MHLDELTSIIGNIKNLDLMNEEFDKKEEKEIEGIKVKYSKKKERLAAQVEGQRQQVLDQVGENFNNRYKGRGYYLHGVYGTKTYYDLAPASCVDFCESLKLKVVGIKLSNYKTIQKEFIIPYTGTFLVTLLGPHKFIVQSDGKIIRAVERSDHSCLEIEDRPYGYIRTLDGDIVMEKDGTEISLVKKPNITYCSKLHLVLLSCRRET